MIDKIDTNQIGDILEKSTSKQHNATRATNDAEDASLQVDYASFIDKAKQIPQEDANAVQEAQELLLCGRLESPENIRAAAENIVKFGV